MRSTGSASAAALVAAALFTLTACGGASGGGAESGGGATAAPAAATPSPSPKHRFDGLTGAQILRQSLTAQRAARSVTVQGEIVMDGKPMSVNLSMDKGGDCTGTVAGHGEGSVELIKNAKYLYFKADEQFLRHSMKDESKATRNAAVEQLGNRWVRTRASGPEAREMAEICDLDEVLTEFDDTPPAVMGKDTQVGGVPAVMLTHTSAEGNETYWVATQGEPYLLKTTVVGQENGNLAFSRFNEPVVAEAPKASDVFDADAA
ncbi:hypothetical protein [Streptomyces sp. NPDC012888]|uniref:hypothetical protein n=1 Tax=Streptomyces sp. NPDC012888 TaxID=3364855 RepID=UPI0036ABBA54